MRNKAKATATYLTSEGHRTSTGFTSIGSAEEWKQGTDHTAPGFIVEWSVELTPYQHSEVFHDVTARANALIVAAMSLETAHVASGEEQPKGNLCVSCFAPISKGERFCAPCDPRE